ncbi:unnamed protein product [Cuscuta campestris]|uniref:Uncharacterized protein n=1 Tax=Cuscuta campestris TaxID=132261 RepID=A0A484LT97_9ASTE|nr:unnamed protein product [Cuscuta campestris]
MEIYRQKRSNIFEDLTSSSLSSSPRAQNESAVHLSVRPDPSPVSSPSHRHWTKREISGQWTLLVDRLGSINHKCKYGVTPVFS